MKIFTVDLQKNFFHLHFIVSLFKVILKGFSYKTVIFIFVLELKQFITFFLHFNKLSFFRKLLSTQFFGALSDFPI